MRQRLVPLAAAILGLLPLSAAAHPLARPFLFTSGRFTAEWAGRPWSYDQQCWDHMVGLGVTMTTCGLAWTVGEPQQGQYDFSYSDFCVAEITARSMEPFFYLGDTPDWAKLRPDLPGWRTPPAEEYADEFMAFHQMVAERYRGQVRYYVFWNEPNGCPWISDGCNNADSYPLYTQWLIRCSQAVKAGDPDAKVIGGNIDYHDGMSYGWEYIQGMYDHGAGPYIDGIAIHSYSDSGTLHWQAILDTRDVMVAEGDGDKGIWITEYGWNSGTEQEISDKLTYVLTELKEPEWDCVHMAKYLVLNDGAGVENYGLTDEDLVPRGRYYAYQAVDKTFPTYVEFSADVRLGRTPLSVEFTDESNVPGAYSWHWEFGDEGASYDQHPTHVYDDAGLHTVRLTVTGDGGPVTGEKADHIHVWPWPPLPGVENGGFEDNGGSHDAWEVAYAEGYGPDVPPLSNSNPYNVLTPFGDYFAGKITDRWDWLDFTFSQVLEVTDYMPTSDAAHWSLSAHVLLHSHQDEYELPEDVGQTWELGWKSDFSLPDAADDCDTWITLADFDGNFTGNDKYGFHELACGGELTDVPGLRYCALRVHCYNTRRWEWCLCLLDNVSLDVEMGAATPAGHYVPGWNLTSVPVAPADPEPAIVFADLVALGNDLTHNLACYDPGAGYRVYPESLTAVERGRGYWLYLSEVPPGAVVSLAGEKASADVPMPLGDGWSLLGQPHKQPAAWADCLISDGATTLGFSDAAAAGWIDPVAYGYAGGGYFMVRGDGAGDDDALRPWHGYWVLAYQPGLTLIVPTP